MSESFSNVIEEVPLWLGWWVINGSKKSFLFLKIYLYDPAFNVSRGFILLELLDWRAFSGVNQQANPILITIIPIWLHKPLNQKFALLAPKN